MNHLKRLQGIWKLERVFEFDQNLKRYKRAPESGAESFFEFRGNQFCSGNFDEKGNMLPCSDYSHFTVDEDVIILESELFKKASWKWSMPWGSWGNLELVGIKPGGKKAKFIFSKFSIGQKSKIKKYVWLFLFFFFFLILTVLLFSGGGEKTFYVGGQGANIRSCAAVSCDIIALLSKDTEVYLTYNSISNMPEWVKIDFVDGLTFEKLSGYINKIALVEK